MVKTFKTRFSIIPFICILFLLTTAFIFMHSIHASGSNRLGRNQREKVIVSHKVEREDNLWKIASQYYTEEYKDVRDLIDEIKRTNGLKDDTIRYGNSIIVPYYQ